MQNNCVFHSHFGFHISRILCFVFTIILGRGIVNSGGAVFKHIVKTFGSGNMKAKATVTNLHRGVARTVCFPIRSCPQNGGTMPPHLGTRTNVKTQGLATLRCRTQCFYSHFGFHASKTMCFPNHLGPKLSGV